MRVINLRSIALEPRGSLLIIPVSSLIGRDVSRPKKQLWRAISVVWLFDTGGLDRWSRILKLPSCLREPSIVLGIAITAQAA
jgi:hypothetical protein